MTRREPETAEELIAAAVAGSVDWSQLECVARKQASSTAETADGVCVEVARRYLSRTLTWQQADAALNALWAASCLADRFLRGRAYAIFCAFDAGEYERENVSVEDQGEALTKRQLADLGLE
jgi:hypothetical protein